MDKNLLNPGVVPIRALLAGIEVVGDLKKKRQASFAIVSIDDEKIAKSEKKSEPAPQWEWKDLEFRFHPSSKIKIVIYRESRTRIDFAKHLAGQYTGKVSELLNNDATFDLKDEHGAEVTSKSKIKINLCLVPESKDTFEIFMKSVDDNISHMKSGVLASAGNTLILGGLGTVLQLTKSIMDAVAGTHPILGASWSVMSAVYTAVQQTEILDDSVRALADTLRETLGIAKEKPDLLLIKGTDNVIEEIGRTSLKVASLIHEYTRLPFPFRAAKFQLSDDMKSRIAQCQQTCDDLKQKFDRRVNMDTNLQLKIIKDDQLARDIQKWLDAPDSSRNYNDARKKHQKDTCSWFLDGERFREFQERADFLWIKGKELYSGVWEDYPMGRALDAQKDLQLHDKLIRSLISQLWVQCDGIPATLVELYNQHGHGNQQPSTNSLENILYNIINGMHSTYVIIDSLDECIERGETLVWIKGIQTPKISTLHMMVMSRPEPDINEILQTLDERSVDLAEESESDIMIYLEQQLLALATQWDRETRDFIKLTLAGSADGIIVTYGFQVPMGRVTARKQVVTLPKGLHETYDQILLKVNEMDHTDTQTFLRWLCFAVRPLRLSEIAEAISVHFDPENDPHFSPSHRYWNNQDVLKKCSGLIDESEVYYLLKNTMTQP
ncbi:hypothetical protein BJ912DRAFT_925653 [Pholiota molesta]|nr:hypothetical protein BJ912DRAFT_925653 [Pholiota molesta]